MEENEKNYALWLYPETVRRMDSSLELANCQSRSEFVEKALHFYMGYLVTDDTTEYLSKALLTSLRGMLDMNSQAMSVSRRRIHSGRICAMKYSVFTQRLHQSACRSLSRKRLNQCVTWSYVKSCR